MEDDLKFEPTKKVKLDPVVDENDEEDEENFVSLKPTKEKCEVCFLNEFRYKCPGCYMKTCCLKCVNEHKVQKNCDGKYHHEKFIPLSSMSEKTMRKDLEYLNELLKDSDNIKKRLSSVKKNQEQLRFKLLKIYAKKLHNIKIKLAPPIMTRHRENFSFYHTKKFKFCSFLSQDVATGEQFNNYEEIKLLIDPQNESHSLFEIFQGLKIDDHKVLWYLQEKLGNVKLLEDISSSRIFCYICDEEDPRQKLVRRIDWYASFKDVITDLTINEFPTLKFVTYKEFSHFELMYKVYEPKIADTQ